MKAKSPRKKNVPNVAPKPPAPKDLTLEISGMAYGGRGIGRHGGKVFFVKDALPGDCVEASVTQEKKSFGEARLLRLLTSSPHRRDSRCPYSRDCGGCQWQSADDAAQLQWKARFVVDALSKFAGYSLPEPPVVHSASSLHYRNRIQLKCRISGGGKWEVGFFQDQTHELVPIGSCAISAPVLDQFISRLAAFNTPDLNPSSFMMELQEIEEHGVSALIQTDAPRPWISQLTKLIGDLPGCVFAGTDKDKAPYLLFDDVDGLRYFTRPGQFQQVNRPLNRLMRQIVEEEVSKRRPKSILDLFCGSGNLSLPLIKRGLTVTGVEANPQAIETARYNLLANQLRGGTFLTAPASAFLNDCLRKGERFDFVITDPPRAGLEDSVEALVAMGPATLVYVSCDPNTLARDLKVLLASGYTPSRVEAFDFFPQTFHVETLLVCSR